MQQVYHLAASGLSRYYNKRCAVNNLELYLQQGEVLGLLGPNGAGKSTTLQMLAGNLAPTTGSISINGIDLLEQPRAAKHHLGYLSEQPALYKDMTVYEYLYYSAQLHGLTKRAAVAAVMEAQLRCNLDEVQERLIGNLSKGFRQRVGIAQAILHKPAVIILDEPTVGLDPVQIRDIRALIRELAASHSVILSTHILSEVQAICDRVHILNKGETIYSGHLEDNASLEQLFFELLHQNTIKPDSQMQEVA